MTPMMAGIVGKYLIRSFQEPSEPKTALPAPVKEDIVSDEAVCVDGHITGDILCLAEVVVSREAHISGNITCRRCVVSGSVDGSIHTAEYTELRKGAVVQGDIISASVEIESGAIINGCVSIEENMELPASLEQAPPPTPAQAEKPAGIVQPEKPADIVQPERPADIVQPGKPADTVETERPPDIMQPERSVDMVQPETPAKAADPPPPQNNIPDDRWW